MYVDQLLDVLKHSCPRKVAGFFAETIQVCTVMCLGTSDSRDCCLGNRVLVEQYNCLRDI